MGIVLLARSPATDLHDARESRQPIILRRVAVGQPLSKLELHVCGNDGPVSLLFDPSCAVLCDIGA